MKKEYDFSKMKRRPNSVTLSVEETKIPVSMRLEGGTLAHLKTEAIRLGIPYQTLIGSILHRFATGELIDKKITTKTKKIKKAA